MVAEPRSLGIMTANFSEAVLESVIAIYNERMLELSKDTVLTGARHRCL